MAAQRREAERQAREQARLAKERQKAEQQRHAESQQRSAEVKTATTERQIKILDSVLTRVLSIPALTFESLKVTPELQRFDPGPLGVAEPGPDWKDYAPPEPGGLSRLFGGATRYERQTAEARARFDSAVAEHHRREAQRRRALSAASAEHERTITAARTKAAAQNAAIEARMAAFNAGEPDAVEWFVSRILDSSRYPDSFPRKYQVAYRPENRDIVVEFELPPQKVVPAVRAYRYVKARDSIDPLPRPANEVKQRYARLIACVALRTLHEIFAATSADVVEAVVFNGRLSTIDRATGKPARTY